MQVPGKNVLEGLDDPIAEEKAKAKLDAQRIGNYGKPEEVKKAFDASAATATDPLDMLDPKLREYMLDEAARKNVPVSQLVGSKTKKWADADPLRPDLVGTQGWDPLLSVEQNMVRAEKARVDAENDKTGRGWFTGLMASLGGGAAGLAAMPSELAKVGLNAVFDAKTASGMTDMLDVLAPAGRGAREASKWFDTKKRASENILLKDPTTGQEMINWGAVSLTSAKGWENIANMVAGEAVPMFAQYLLGAAAAPVTGGASVAAVTAANAGKLAKVGKFAKAVWAYAKSPVSVVNAGRVITGSAQQGVQEMMAKGMTEDEAWQKVAPGALLSGLFSVAAGSPLEAKIMEDLFSKVATTKLGATFMQRAGARVKSFLAQGTKEGLQEVAEGLGEDLAALVTYSPDKSVKEFASNAIMNFVGGAAMGGIMGAGVHGSQAIHASENATFIASLGDPKLREVLGSQTKDFVNSITEGGSLENLHLDAQQMVTLLQAENSGMTLDEVKALVTSKMGVAPEDFDMALKNKTDLVVRTGLYAEFVHENPDMFQGIYEATRAYQGGGTLGELAKTHANEKNAEEMRKAIAALPENPEREVIAQKIAQMLSASSRVFGEKDSALIAQSYAKVLDVMAQRGKISINDLFEMNKLKILKDFNEKLDQQGAANEKQTEAGASGSTMAQPSTGVPRTPRQGVNSGLPASQGVVPGASGQGPEGTVAGRAGAASSRLGQGLAPQSRTHLFHGETRGAVPDPGARGRAKTGGMGPGVHTTDGTTAMGIYSKNNPDGMWRVALSEDYTPFDATSDNIYSPGEAAQFGVMTAKPVTGNDIWIALMADLGGPDEAGAHLEAMGFDGLHYHYGGADDAWSVWNREKMERVQPTDINAAEAALADMRQYLPARRDSLTGRLIAPTNSEIIAQQADYAQRLDELLGIVGAEGTSFDGEGLSTTTLFQLTEAPGWADKFLKDPRLIKMFGKEAVEQFGHDMLRTAAIYAHLGITPAEDTESSPMRKNMDPMFFRTFDLSTLCPQQEQYVAAIRALEKMYGDVIPPQVRERIGTMMKEVGEATVCWYCYGQSNRDLYDFSVWRATKIFNQATILAWENGTLTEAHIKDAFGVTGGKLSTTGALRGIIDKYGTQLGILNSNDLLALIKGERPAANEMETDLKKAVELFAQGASQANKVKGFAPYTQEVLKFPESWVTFFNEVGGLRLNSQTDFRSWHVVDLSQLLVHSAQRKLGAHAYTKSPWFIKIFGKTQIKFNLSMQAMTVDGKVQFDPMIGFPSTREAAVKRGFPPEFNLVDVRKNNPNAGSMLVITDDAQFRWALDSDTVDMAIPFHAGRLMKEIYEGNQNAKDYADFQHEDWSGHETRLDKKTVKVSKKTGDYTVKMNDGTTVVLHRSPDKKAEHPVITQKSHLNDKARYFEICAKVGIEPKWKGLVLDDGTVVLDHPNYMKLVRDIAAAHSEQVAVDPTKIDWEAAQEFLNQWIDDGGDQTQAKPWLVEHLRQQLNAANLLDKQIAAAEPVTEVPMGEVTLNQPSGVAAPQLQAVDTSSDEFKQWFKNSKLRLDEGQPQPFYHVTNKQFDTFVPGGTNLDAQGRMASGPAIWFTSAAEHQPAAHSVGAVGGGFQRGTAVMKVFLRMERPLLIDDRSMLEWAQEAYADGWKEFPQLLPPKVVAALKADGYDGIIFKGTEIYNNPKPSDDEYIVFDADQVKSAWSNTGEFSGETVLNQPVQSPLGFYSQLEAMIPQLTKSADKNGMVDPKQVLAAIKGKKGELRIKDDELNFTQLPEFLELLAANGVKKVRVEEITEWVQKGGLVVTEKVRGKQDPALKEALRVAREKLEEARVKVRTQEKLNEAMQEKLEAEIVELGVDEFKAYAFLSDIEELGLPTVKQLFKELKFRDDVVSEDLDALLQHMEVYYNARKVEASLDFAYRKASDAEHQADLAYYATASTKFGPYAVKGEFTDYTEVELQMPGRTRMMDLMEYKAEQAYDLLDRLHDERDLNFKSIGAPDFQQKNDELNEAIEAARKEADRINELARLQTEFAFIYLPHWDSDVNVLAHFRYDHRVVDGKVTMFIQEVQSDWGQRGEKDGWRDEREADQQKLSGFHDKLKVMLKDGIEDSPEKRKLEKNIRKLEKKLAGEGALVDPYSTQRGPIVTDTKAWLEFALKRIVRYASEQGFDQIMFANGEQNAEHYHLSKQVERIEWGVDGENTFDIQTYDLNGHKITQACGSMPLGQIEATFGKGIADQIYETNKKQIAALSYEDQRSIEEMVVMAHDSEHGVIRGANLDIGDEGMIHFYNSILPSVLGKVMKALGGAPAEVGKLNIRSGAGIPTRFDLKKKMYAITKDEYKNFGGENYKDFDNNEAPLVHETSFVIDGEAVMGVVVIDRYGATLLKDMDDEPADDEIVDDTDYGDLDFGDSGPTKYEVVGRIDLKDKATQVELATAGFAGALARWRQSGSKAQALYASMLVNGDFFKLAKGLNNKRGTDVKFESTTSVATTDQYAAALTPEVISKVTGEGQTLFQPTMDGDQPKPRGNISWPSIPGTISPSSTGSPRNGKPRTLNMKLFELENKSTVFHELGHFYLELLADVAEMSAADQSVKDDFQKILNWLGAKDRSEITAPMHERFADGHLVYLMEGKAPTEELQQPFKKYTDWLTKLAKKMLEKGENMLGVQVNMSDEVRGVFDRLYASEREIEDAKKSITFQMFTTAEQARMSQAEFKVYSESVKQEVDAAKERMTQRLMKQLANQEKKEYKAQLQEITDRITNEIDAQPEYQVVNALRSGLLEDGETEVPKLSRGLLIDMYGEEILAKLPKGIVTNGDNSTSPDEVATLLDLFGTNGDTLIQALTDLPDRDETIKKKAQAEMDLTHPNAMSDPDALREMALEILQGEGRERVLNTELQALRRAQREAAAAVKVVTNEAKAAAAHRKALEQKLQRIQADNSQAALQAKKALREELAKIAKQEAAEREQVRKEASTFQKLAEYREAAANHIRNMPVWKLNPGKHLTDQRTFSRQSYEAALNQKFQAAADFKEQEILSHFLYVESQKAVDRADKFRSYIKRSDSASARRDMALAGNGLLAQFDKLRDRFGIERVANKEIARRQDLQTFMEDMSDKQVDIFIEEWILDETQPVRNYRELTVAQLDGVHDALKSIRNAAKLERSAQIDGKRVMYDTIFAELTAAAEANLAFKPVHDDGSPKTDEKLIRAQANLMGLDATMVKILQLVNWIDNNKKDGPAHRYIWQPMVQSQMKDYELSHKINKVITDAFAAMPRSFKGTLNDTFDLGIKGEDGQPRMFYKKEIIGMLLYNGQDTRLKKLLGGRVSRGLNEAAMLKAFTNLTVEDLKLAESVWSAFDQIKPEVLALEERLTGVRPKWEGNRQFDVTIKGGTTVRMNGGYFPLVADRSGGWSVAKKQEGDSVLREMAGPSYTRARTSQSHTKDIKGKMYPLLLDFQRIVTAELSNQIKDIAYRENVLMLNRIFRSEKFTDTMFRRLGPDYTKQFEPWLVNIISDRNTGASANMAEFEGIFGQMRARASSAMIAFKLASLMVQPADLTRTLTGGAHGINPLNLANAWLQLNPANPNRRKTIDMIKRLSPTMVMREENVDRDLRANMQRLSGDESWNASMQRFGYAGFTAVDGLISWPVWLAKYNSELAKNGGDEKLAALAADDTVNLRLQAGAPKDLAPIQAYKNPAARLFTMFFGDATNNYNMLREAGHNINGFKGIPAFTGATMLLMLGQIIGAFLQGQWPDDEGDPEAWAKWAGVRAAMAPLTTVPFGRDVANMGEAVFLDKPVMGMSFSPALSIVQKVGAAVTLHPKRFAAGDEEFVDFLINEMEAVGYVTGTPGTSQATASAKYFRRYMAGEEQPSNPFQFAWDLARGKRKEKN